MKFLHLFLILVFINTFIVSRKVNSKTQQIIQDIIPIDVMITNYNYYNPCKLHKADLENPTGDKKEKLFFYECTGNKYDTNRYFLNTAYKEAENTLSLEYRYITTFSTVNYWQDFGAEFNHPTRGKISFYFSGIGSDYKVKAKLMGWLNTNTQTAKGAVNALKDTALAAAVNYSTSKQSNDAALKGLEGIKAQIPTFETTLTTLATALTNKDTQIADDDKQIAELSAKLAVLQTQRTNHASERLATEDEITKTKADQATLQAQVTKGTADAEATKTSLNDAKTNWDSAYSSLKTNSVGQEKIVDTANTELITNNNLEKAKTAIISVR
jgi:hypothetical protein